MAGWKQMARQSVLLGLLLVSALVCKHVAAAPAQWTILVYMLADNNLEPFALMDLEEIMFAMATEQPGDCKSMDCGADCPSGLSETYTTPCSSGGLQRRCCTRGNYPDVLVYVDKGQGSALDQRVFNLPHADYSLLETSWTSAKQVVALPGGQWQKITEDTEIDMAKPQTITDFLKDALNRYPPGNNRKYMLVFWDHGSGWMGYGADAKCTSYQAYNDANYCDFASLATITQGLKDGLVNPTTGQPMKLDIIGFDACLMAMYEVGSVLAPYTNYLLGSEMLEPGTGWDYTALSNLVTGTTVANQYVNANTGFTEKDLADVLIAAYLESPATGLTLALMDLRAMKSSLDFTMSALSTTLLQQMSATPALSMQLLQQRTLLGLIDGAEENVDLGALLTRLSAVTKGDLKTRLNATLAAYRSVVVAYDRDGILPDGTGMTIYFPPALLNMDRSYRSFVQTDPADLSGWYSFLQGLYTAIGSIGITTDLAFKESYAVPYWAVASNTWITHGTLTSLTALTADLMYGFISPTGRDYIVAGATNGRIAQYAAVGAWSGQLFGLVQDLTPGDGAVDGLALAYADEQRLTDSEGNVQRLILQMQVYYAKSCYAAVSEMTPGMLKYDFDLATMETNLQLFVSSGGSKAWGEIAHAAGGVIIPYLGTIDLTGVRLGQGSSFGYSDCLKWGYDGSLMVAAFNATQAVGILGLDLTRDLATMLTVRGLNGRVKVLYGAFESAQKTQGGCQCAQLWTYKDASTGNDVTVKGQCVNPFGDPSSWCQYEPESCTGSPTQVNGQALTDLCAPVTTLSGCTCHPHWRYGGADYYGSCANSGDPRGSWCVVDRASCGNYRAHEFGSANTTSATINGNQSQLTGLDFDYCQVTTNNKCRCSNTWEFGCVRYNGTCRTGLYGNTSVPGITSDTNWCLVDKACPAGKRLDGFIYDLCTPEGGRVTESGAPCQFPASYHGIPLYDCISYNHNTPGLPAAKPWCFTNTATGAWGYCAPWTCTAAIKSNCPAGSPAGSTLAGWAAPACVETLCNARKDLANISLCTQDSQADRDLLAGAYSILTSNASFGQLLGSDSLDTYCSMNFGYLCMDQILDPACPALFRQNNAWMAATGTAQLCDLGCLKAMCRLQEQAKTSVTGTPGVSGNVSQITCADGELTTSVMWSLMRLIDTTCGWPGPANLACNKLLSPPQLCAADTQISASAGNLTDGAPLGSNYSASTECQWTINLPEQPYISLNFTRLSTEPLYDTVTVEDFDGLIGRFSGTSLPSSLSTDTGLLRIKFSADASLQGQGFATTYLASSNPQTNIPTCTSGTKLLQVVLRTRGYGNEISWLVTKRSLLNMVFAPTPNEQNIVMAGGALPPSVRSKVPQDVAATSDTEYKDYRSYYTYACLTIGSYNLFTYDSYGDGWEGGRITLTQIVNATTGCVLLSGASPTRYNLTTPFAVTADADTSSAACSALTSPDGPYFYVEAGLVVMGEDTNTFTLAKQRKIKEALATLLDMDGSQVTIQSLANATTHELTDGQQTVAEPSRSNRRGLGGHGGAAAAVMPSRSGVQHATRRLQGAPGMAAAPRDVSAATTTSKQDYASAPGDSIYAMLQQQQHSGQRPRDSGLGISSSGGSRLQALSRVAVSIPELVASGVLTETQQQLLQAETWLNNQAAAASSAVTSTTGAQPHQSTLVAAAAVGPQHSSNALSQPSRTRDCGGGASGCVEHASGLMTAADEADAEAAAAADVAAAVADTDTGDAVSAAVATGDAAYVSEQLMLAESRKLQQLLTLSNDGVWQDAAGAAPDDNSSTTTTDSTSSTDASSGSTGAANGMVSVSDVMANALLAEKPLGPSAGAAPVSAGPSHSHLMQQLQAQVTVKPLQQVRTVRPASIQSLTGGSTISAASNNIGRLSSSRVRSASQVVVSFSGKSLADAFRQPRSTAAGAAAAAATAAKTKAGSSAAIDTAAVPKPLETQPAAAAAVPGASAPPQSMAAAAAAAGQAPIGSGDELSFVPQALPFTPQADSSTGIDNTTFLMFDAIRPGRALTQLEGTDPSSSGAASSRIAGVASSSGADGHGDNVGSNALLLSGVPPELLVGPAQVDPQVFTGMIDAGRHRPPGTPRPRPHPEALRPPGTRRRLTSSSIGAASTAPAWRQQLKQQEPGNSEADAVMLPLSWPEQLLARSRWTATAEEGSTSQRPGRQLLQAGSPSRGVTVVVRVNGYDNTSQATAAATALSALVKNGSLQTTLANQGWPGVTIGLLYATTGSVGSFWARPDMLRVIIGACVGGGALLCIIGVMVYMRRRRQAGAAQIPPGGSAAQAGARMGAGPPGGPGGRMSFAPSQAPYLSPQQAAAVVVPYPSSPYGRAASPSAPLLLSPSQQAAFASPAASPGSSRAGRASMGPYPTIQPPGGYGSVAMSGGSYSGPVLPMQLQQQQPSYYPAPTGRLSPYGAAPQPAMGYPVITPPGAQQQNWQQLQ